MSNLIGGFEVDFRSTLGSGSYGMVYKAKNMETGEPVAAKQAFIRSAAKDIPRIINEVANMKYVSHPNLVRYHHHHDDQGTFWVFVELCDLGDLDQYFMKKNPDRQEYTQLMQQMTAAIEFLHKSGIVHRDIKPGNIVLKSGENPGGLPIVKIGDFGLAKIVDLRYSSNLSFSTLNVGTRLYMAPELFIIVTTEMRCDKSVDIFALGITFFSMICFKTEADRLVPAEDRASRSELGCGYRMHMLHEKGKIEKARRYHKEFVQVKGDDVERMIRELIQKMIHFENTERVQASFVLSAINDVINVQLTKQVKLDVDGSTEEKQTRPVSLPVEPADEATIVATCSPGVQAVGFTGQDQKSGETDSSGATGATTPESAGNGSIGSGPLGSNKSNEIDTQDVAGAPSASNPVLDSGFSDLQIRLERNAKAVAVFRQKASIEAVRWDPHRVICAATETARDANKLALKVWEKTDHQCWKTGDIFVTHTLNLNSSPESAGVIAILEDCFLLRVRLDDDRRQLLAVDSTSGEVLRKTPVYPGRGVAAYCCYKKQILLPDWKKSSSITQLDAMTFKELNTWTNQEVVEPGSICSSRKRFAVCYNDDTQISVFKWESLLLSHEIIYTVEFECKSIQLLPDNTLMAWNCDREWSVWNENGDADHYSVEHPQLTNGRKVYPRAIQDPVSGEWFVQELVKVHREKCTVIYNARIVINRLESGEKTRIDNSLLQLNTATSYE